MLLLKSFTSDDRSIVPPLRDSYLRQIHVLYFHYAPGFSTQILAYMLDSLVRVSRRVNENHFVSILERAVYRTGTQQTPTATAQSFALCSDAAPGRPAVSWAHVDAPCGSPRSPPRWASPGSVTGTDASAGAPPEPRGLLPRLLREPILTRAAEQDPPLAFVARCRQTRRGTGKPHTSRERK